MADIKERIARRTAKELRDGELVNLGIGLPTMVGSFVPEDIIIHFTLKTVLQVLTLFQKREKKTLISLTQVDSM